VDPPARGPDLARSLASVTFMAVPHTGNKAAAAAASQLSHVHRWLTTSLSAPHLSTLGSAADLAVLDASFRGVLEARGKDLPTTVTSLGEGTSTPLMRGAAVTVVPPDVANPRYGTFRLLPGVDHITICKPNSPADASYVAVLSAVAAALPVAGFPPAARGPASASAPAPASAPAAH